MSLSQLPTRVGIANFIKELIGENMKPLMIHVDTKLAVELTKKSAFHSYWKDIKIHYHHARNYAEDAEVKVHHIAMEEQRAKPLTKSL